LYVITNDKNIGEEINKILTMESLKIWQMILNNVIINLFSIGINNDIKK
jgi:hypothetical protein